MQLIIQKIWGKKGSEIRRNLIKNLKVWFRIIANELFRVNVSKISGIKWFPNNLVEEKMNRKILNNFLSPFKIILSFARKVFKTFHQLLSLWLLLSPSINYHLYI